MILFIIALALLLLAILNVFSLHQNVSKAFAITAVVLALLLLLQVFGVIALRGHV